MNTKATPKKTPPRKSTAPRPSPAPEKPPTLAGELESSDQPAETERTPEEMEIEKIATLLGREDLGGATVRLHRRALTDANPTYLGEMALANFTLENVKNVYGGGDYTYRVVTSGNRFATSGRFSISHLIPAKIPGQADPVREDPTAAIMEKLTAIIKPIIDRQTAPVPPPPPPDNGLLLQLMKSQGEMTLALITSMAARQPQTDPALAATLAKIEASLSQRQNTGGVWKEAREMFEFIQANTAAPEKPEKESGFMDAIGKGIGQFLPALAQQFSGRPQPLSLPQTAQPIPMRAVHPVNPADAIAPSSRAENGAAAAEPISTTANPTETVNPFLSRFAVMAIKSVNQGKTPQDFVDALMLAAAGFEEHVFQIARDDDWKRKIFTGPNWAAIEPHADWLDEVRAGVIEKQFVAYCENAAAQNVAASLAVGHFVTQHAPQFYLPYLDGMTDPAEIAEVFNGSTVPPDWITAARNTIAHLMNDAKEKSDQQRKASGG